MQTSGGARVTITEEGRSGSVTWQQHDQTVTGWWEFAGGDAIALVRLDAPSDWPAEQRAAVFRFVADEVIRQKCSGGRAEIDAVGGWITVWGS